MKNSRRFTGLGIFLLVGAIGRLWLNSEREAKQVNDAKLLAGIRTTIMESQDKKIDSIALLVEAQGQIFVYTDDSLAEAEWVPNIVSSADDYYQQIGGVRAGLSQENDYSYFIQNYKSLGFLLYAGHKKETQQLLSNAYLYGNGAHSLHFMGLYALTQLKTDKSVSDEFKEMAAYNPSTVWEMGFDNAANLSTDSITTISLTKCIKAMKKRPSFHLYMVGVENDRQKSGIDTTAFSHSVRVLNLILSRNGVDTNRFYKKVFPVQNKSKA